MVLWSDKCQKEARDRIWAECGRAYKSARNLEK